MRNVLILSDTHGPGHGAEEVLLQMLRARPAADLPIALEVCAPEHSRVYREADGMGYQVHRLTTRKSSVLSNIPAMWRTGRLLSAYDVVHAWSARMFEPPRFSPYFSRFAFSGTLHDHPCAYFHGRGRQFLMRWGSAAMDGLVCVSDAVKTACRDKGYTVPTRVIHNGLNEADVPARPAQGRAIHAGFLGMYAEWKGFETILPWIENSGSHITWHLYGDPLPQYLPLIETLRQRSPAGLIIEGRQPPAEIYSTLDLLIQPSTFFDPLPTTLIEAARAGIPVVARDIGGVTEIVRQDVTGYMYTDDQTGAALFQRLVEDGEARSRMGQAARAHWEEAFRAERMLADYLAFWDTL